MKVSSTTLIALLSLTTSCVVEGRVGKANNVRRLKKDNDEDMEGPVLAAEAGGLPQLQIVGNDGSFSSFPLGLCQGECDTDEDCAEGLMCFQREPNESVPGCQDGGPGFGSRGDYCVTMPTEEGVGDVGVVTDGPTEIATDAPTEVVPAVPCTLEMAFCPDGSPMQRDTDCRWMTELCPGTMSPTQDGEEVPETAIMAMERTESPTEGATLADTMEVTEVPTEVELLRLTVAGQNGSPASAFPLSLCQGDCDDDDECGEGLVCLQRGRGDPVPGCAYNGLDFTTDFCVPASM